MKFEGQTLNLHPDEPKPSVSSLDVMDALVWFLKSRYLENDGGQQLDAYGFLIRNLKVKFTDEVVEEGLYSGYAESTYIVLAPIIPNESTVDRDQRRRSLLLFFGPLIPEAQLRASAQIHRLLSKAAQEELLRKYKEHMESKA